jgi:hypothetical protein
MPDSDLRQALLGTWRLVNFQADVDSKTVKPWGDNPQDYLVYTPDEHVFVQFATRAQRGWPGPEVLDLPGLQAASALGFVAYCGTFEVRDGQVVHHVEFGILPRLSGLVEPRSVGLAGNRLILATQHGLSLEWQRVH